MNYEVDSAVRDYHYYRRYSAGIGHLKRIKH